MKRRRWVVLVLAVLAVAALLVVVSLRSASAPPFKFIHGRKVHTEVVGWNFPSGVRAPPYTYDDYYVFPGSVEGVRKEAAKELASLGYRGVNMDGSLWLIVGSRGLNYVEIEDGSNERPWTRNGWSPALVPPGSVIVRVGRNEPSSIERIQEWAHRIGL